MDRNHHYAHFYNEIQPAIRSKVEEFNIFGYEKVTEKDLWEFLTRKKWKKFKEDIHLYEVVADVLSVKIGELMNFTTVEAFKLGDFSLEDEEERKALFK
jgi:hypothetical protein